MLTVNDVRLKIQDISSKYHSGAPQIHISHLMDALNVTKGELASHLDELHKQGLITFYDEPLKHTFSLSGSAEQVNM